MPDDPDTLQPDPDRDPPMRAGRSDRRRRDDEDDDRDDEYDRRRPPRKYDEEGNEITSDDTMWGMFAHLGLFLLGFLAPLIIFFIYKDKSPFVTRHAKAALNHTITFILFVFGWMLVAVLIGFAVYGVSQEPIAGVVVGYILFLLGMITLSICQIVFIIMATVAASKGNHYRYPMSISFLG